MKIAYRLVERLARLTNREMDLFLCLAKYQDDSGKIENVYYKTILDKTGMCKQTFYSSMRSLENRGVIKVLAKNDSDFVVKILDNDFSNKDFSGGYINLNRNIFHQRKFKRLKVKAKWLLMEMMKNTHVKGRAHHLYCENFYEKYGKILGVGIRMLREYLHAIKEYFYIGRKKGQYYITARDNVLKNDYSVSQYEQRIEYFIKEKCRKNKILAPARVIEETVKNCFKKRDKALKEAGYDICRVFAQVLLISVQDKAERILNPKYINKLITKAIS